MPVKDIYVCVCVCVSGMRERVRERDRLAKLNRDYEQTEGKNKVVKIRRYY